MMVIVYGVIVTSSIIPFSAIQCCKNYEFRDMGSIPYWP